MSGFVPVIGDVVILNHRKYVLFYINYDIPAHENGENFFKKGYYFVSEEYIKQNNMIQFDSVKDGVVIYKKRYELFSNEQKTDEKYNVSKIKMLKFEKI